MTTTCDVCEQPLIDYIRGGQTWMKKGTNGENDRHIDICERCIGSEKANNLLRENGVDVPLAKNEADATVVIIDCETIESREFEADEIRHDSGSLVLVKDGVIIAVLAAGDWGSAFFAIKSRDRE